MKFTKWMRGYYRLSDETRFAGIKHERDGWHVEIRDSDTGTLQRYAGIWPTLKDAREEAARVLNPTHTMDTWFCRRDEVTVYGRHCGVCWQERYD